MYHARFKENTQLTRLSIEPQAGKRKGREGKGREGEGRERSYSMIPELSIELLSINNVGGNYSVSALCTYASTRTKGSDIVATEVYKALGWK